MVDKKFKKIRGNFGGTANELIDELRENGSLDRDVENFTSVLHEKKYFDNLKNNDFSSNFKLVGRDAFENKVEEHLRMNSKISKVQGNMAIFRNESIIQILYNFLYHNKCEKIESFNIFDRVVFNKDGEILELNLSDLNLKVLEKLDTLPLEYLKKLDLSYNSLGGIRIKNYLPNIEKIDVKGNPLEFVVINSGLKSIDCLINVDVSRIVKLNLSDNNFTSFSFNKKYNSLRKFIMCGNKSLIREIKISGRIPLLEELILIESNIESFIIENEISQNFNRLDIRKNKINYLKLPHEFFEKKDEKFLNIVISENPLPDLFLSALEKPTQEEVYRDLKDIFSDTIIVHKVKLIFLGNTGVGKTTLYKALKYGDDDYIEQNGNSTEGVNIFNYNFTSKKKKRGSTYRIEVKGYDFGGQDYYHNTHYSHFSSNALYILLWGNGQYIYHRSHFKRFNSNESFSSEITYPLNYWLGSVAYFSKSESNQLSNGTPESQNIKLHLIQNPIKITGNKSLNKYELNRVDLKERYSFIESFDECDSLTSDNFENYRSNIVSRLNSIIDSYAKPQSYPNILAKVEQAIKNEFNEIIVPIEKIKDLFIRVNDKTINWKGSFEQIIEWLDVTMSVYWVSDKKLEKLNKIINNKVDGDECNQLDLLDFHENEILNNSSFISFEQRELLRSNVILDLSKMDDIIHSILISTSSKSKKGYYTKSDFEDHEYFKDNKTLRDYVFAFMLYNKISFEAPDKNGIRQEVYIAPSYLNNELSLAEELFLNSFDLPLVEYRFEDFYHVNVFTEVLVQFKKNLSNSDKTIDYLLWKNKAVLFDYVNSTNSLEVFSDRMDCKMHPLVYLEFDLGDILNEDSNKKIDDHSFLKKPSIRISTYAKNRYSVGNVFMKKIINFIDNQLVGYTYKKYALAPNNLDYVDVQAIDTFCLNHNGNSTGLFTYNNHLYRFADFGLFTKKKSAMKKIFISHSTEDYRELQNFTTHLSPLKKLGLIDHWHCSQLVVGEQWDSNIQEKLWDSDIICMLISPSWLANEYIFEKELKIALERKERFRNSSQGKDIILFPIIVKSCSWHLVEALSSIQAAPQKAKTINSYADQNEAWTDVIRKLNDVLRKMDDPEYIPLIGERLGKFYVDQYEGNLSKIN